jgi:hypothetical protein
MRINTGFKADMDLSLECDGWITMPTKLARWKRGPGP